MFGKVPSMDVRLVAALSGVIGELNVAEFCRDRKISRQTFYKYRRRYQAGGLEALESLSRAPRGRPGRTSVEIEDKIVALRKELNDRGVDAGPATIQWHLGRGSVKPVPSEATIWRILDRRGFIVHEPRKRPKSSWCRFEAGAPNELWQADATKWVVADHTGLIEIINYLDDHSRVLMRAKAVEAATVGTTWEAFSEAVHQWGLPAGHLSDNGLNFSGKLRGFEVAFEANLRAAGVRQITSSPGHPQTCGKVERFQQTEKKWLRAQPMAANLDELQQQLDTFADYYNQQRPHRGIGRITPWERWQATPPITTIGTALPGPRRTTEVTVDERGVAGDRPWQIHIGVTHAGKPARILFDDTHAAVYIDGSLIRHLKLDTTRRYQPSGLPRRPRPT